MEKLCELGTILLFGSMMSAEGLASPGWKGWLVVFLLILVVRPITVAAGFARSRLRWRDRAFLGWFGVRGIGSVYYAAAILTAGALAQGEAETIFWTTARACSCRSSCTGSPGAR